MRKLFNWLVLPAALLMAVGTFDAARAQNKTQTKTKDRPAATGSIEKIENKRISGTAYRRFNRLTYEQCANRCLADAKCLSLEFYHGGRRVVSRSTQCRLFSIVGDPIDNQNADIGLKRQTSANQKPAEQAPAAAGPDKPREAKQMDKEATAAPPPSAPPAAPPPPPPAQGSPAPPAPAAPAPAPSAPSPPPATRSIRPPPAEWDIVPVFYGTDRSRKDLEKRIAYGSDRARRLELGQALITVPKSHQVPNVERPWAIKIPYLDISLYQESEDPRKHFTIKELKALSKDELLALVTARLGTSAGFKDQALIMIHGYNNNFDDALYRTAQFAYDLKFDGAPFLYSWPSAAGITSYPYDRESAVQAEQYLARFLLMVLNEAGAKSVNIIAHSMGNQPLLQVLKDLKRSNPAEVARINQIILAAPDVDRDAFEYLAGQINGVGRGITMYVSSNDVALGVSRRFAGGVPRAGDVPVGGPSVVAGIDTIDVSGLSTDYLAINHSSYAEKSALIQDIELVLRTGERPPEARFPILRRIVGAGGVYWQYPR